MKKSIRLLCSILGIIAVMPFCGTVSQTETTATADDVGLSASVSETYLSERFDARDYGFVPAVKDQGDSNICWAYASANASEISVLRNAIDNSTAQTLSLSPVNLAYARHNRGADPLGNTPGEYTNQPFLTTPGDPQYAATVLSQWCGPTSASSSGTSDQWKNSQYHLNNAVHIFDSDITNIKKAVVRYGAVTFAYDNRREALYHNPVNEPSGEAYLHACTIIGWDDTIPASNFVPRGATRNGGWLIKNSYDTLPYFYISYDTTNSSVWAFDYTTKDTYQNNYFYDYSTGDGLSGTLKIKTGATVFTSKKDNEYIKAVNVGFFGKEVTCSVKVYTGLTDADNPESGTLSGTGSQTFEYQGYRTVELDSPVKVEKGSDFAVVVSVSNPTDNALIRVMQYANGKTFRYRDYWSRINFAARIKAFTSCDDSDAPAPSKTDISAAQVNINADNTVFNGQAKTPTVTVTCNGKTLVSGTDYSIAYANNVNAGTATVTVIGTGDYEGTKTASFTIAKAENPPVMPNAVITVDNDVTALSGVSLPNGWRWQNGAYGLSVGNNAGLVAEYSDTANYENARVSITVVRNAKDEPDSPPESTNIESAQVSLSASAFEYDGQAKTPTVTVTCNGKTLVSGTDYSIAYANNVNAGTATVTVIGTGDYEGTKTASFTIAKAENPPVMPNAVITVDNDVTVLSSVSLPNGWRWQNGAYGLSVGNNACLVAEYSDTANYENARVSVTVVRNAKDEPDSPPDKDDAENEKPKANTRAIVISCVCGGIVLIVAVSVCIKALRKNKRS